MTSHVAAAILVLLAGACKRLDTRPDALLHGFDLVVVNIDSLRADHLGTYGYARDTSPFIDELASKGVVFEHASSTSSFTRESVASLMTGLLPTRGGGIGWAAAPSPDARTLAELLSEAGYRTGLFSNTVMLGNPNFRRGFDAVHNLPSSWDTSRMGPELSAEAARFAERHAGDPLFLYLHYLDPHGPYDPPDEYVRRFAKGPSEEPLRIYGGLRRDVPRLRREGFGPGDPRFEDLVSRYDAEISHTDEAIEQLFGDLRRLGRLDRTLVVITADHGEEFLEHDFVEHAWTLYEESLRIPLIFWAPDALPSGRSEAPVSAVDVLPTLADLLGIPAENGRWDGRPLFDGRGRVVDRSPGESTIVAELMIRERNVLRSVTKGEWKYIATYRWLDPEERAAAAATEQKLRERGYASEFDPWGPVVREELYRISEDATERRDLSDRHPEKLDELRDALAAYRARTEAEGSPRQTGEKAPELTPEERERLHALGYL